MMGEVIIYDSDLNVIIRSSSNSEDNNDRTNDIQVSFFCNVCGAPFTSVDQCATHPCSIKLKKSIKNCTDCVLCDKTFKTSSLLRKHVLFCHPPITYQCRMCEKRFPFFHLLKCHLRIHTNENPYQCSICGRRFPAYNSLKSHEAYSHIENHLECSYCGYLLPTRQSLENHVRRQHTKKRSLQCKICEKSFMSTSVLYQHRQTHSSVKNFECNYCSKLFRRKETLNIHVRIHTGEKPFNCPSCKSAFRQCGDMLKHCSTQHPGFKDENVSKMKNMDISGGAQINVNSDGYHILAEHSISFDKTYIQDLAVKRTGEDLKCAVTTSCCSSEVYTLTNQFKPLVTLKSHSNQVTNIRFSHESDNVLYTSSLDGTIKVWDLRGGECVKELKDTNSKPLSCMDISCNDRLLCAGTELVDGDAFLLFWDIRSRKLLGGYWESHTDDITSVSFHPSEPDTVASGSTDGLVNLFDLRESSEDDALQTSLNTESSVSRTRWNSNDLLSVITHTETIQLWDRNGSAPNKNWCREGLANALVTPTDDCYVVDVHSHSETDLFSIVGSHTGKGEKLQVLLIGNEKITPGLPFIGNRQTIRCSAFLPQNDLIITGGENGYLCAWKTDLVKNNSSARRIGKNRNKLKHKPY